MPSDGVLLDSDQVKMAAMSIYMVLRKAERFGASFTRCPKGLICLGCAQAQPKKSAVSIFRRMLASHERSLVAARGHSEPAGQIAAREMEIVRIKGALQRAEELSDDVGAAIDRAL